MSSTSSKMREGDTRETLAHDLPEAVDLVLLDGMKALYCEILDLIEPHLRPGALIVADNVDMTPDFLARVRGTGGNLSVPFGDDVDLSMKVGGHRRK